MRENPIGIEKVEVFEVGDVVQINTLITAVEEIKHEYGEVFLSTEYGDFNSRICKKL